MKAMYAGLLAAGILSAPLLTAGQMQVRADLKDPSQEKEVMAGQDIKIDKKLFPDEDFLAYVKHELDPDPDGVLTQEEILSINSIDVDGIPIRSLAGIEIFTELEVLDCNFCEISELDLSGNPKLKELYCFNGKLEKLNVSGNTDLETLMCNANQIETLDVTKNTKLKQLDCFENNLDRLDISKCPELFHVDCYGNHIRELDTSKNSKLEYISCGYNPIEKIDVSANKKLKEFWCYGANLSRVDLSGHKDLYYLSLAENPMDAFYICDCPILFELMEKYPLQKADDTHGGTEILYSQGQLDINGTMTDCAIFFNASATMITDRNATPAPKKPTVAPTTTPVPPSVKMPDVIGMQPEEAKTLVEKELMAGGFEEVIVRFGWVDMSGRNAGLVVDQTPEADEIVYITEPSITVYLTVSEDYPTPAPVSPTPGDPTPKPDDPTPVPGDPTPDPEKEQTFEAFVERLYEVALNRASEPEGKAFWVEKVKNGEYNGADCARFFLIEAPEFMNRNLDNSDFLEVLYKTFYDRKSDANGKAYWMGRLENGTERVTVVNDFIESTEWCNVCATYGVRSGALYHKAEYASKNAIEFATRLYTCCLGRAAEEKGLRYWSLALTNLEQTGYSAAKQFFTGGEFVNLKTSDEEYVKRLYTTFMGRDPEASEVSYWAGEIKANRQNRTSVLEFFGGSEEFTKICNQYGIERGEVN